MSKADKEDLAAVAAKRATFRLHHVGTKLNEHELRELTELLDERGETQCEFIGGLILAEIERDRAGERASAELVDHGVQAAVGELPATAVGWASRCRWRRSTRTSRRFGDQHTGQQSTGLGSNWNRKDTPSHMKNMSGLQGRKNWSLY